MHDIFPYEQQRGHIGQKYRYDRPRGEAVIYHPHTRNAILAASQRLSCSNQSRFGIVDKMDVVDMLDTVDSAPLPLTRSAKSSVPFPSRAVGS